MAEKKLKSLDEVSESIRKIGERQRAFDRIQIRMNNQIDRIKTKAEKDGLPHQEAIDQLFERIFKFAQPRYNELTEKGAKKTVSFSTGEMLWRLTKPAVSFEDKEEVIVERCESRGLKRFVQIIVIKKADKQEMLREPEIAAEIEGVSIQQKEKFVVKPAKVSIEISRETGRLEKILPRK